MGGVVVERTGRAYSIASNEFRVSYPDGHVATIWSPPWHDMEPDEELATARRIAEKMFAAGEHRMIGQPVET